MTIEQWSATPEAYLAILTLIALVLAIYYTIRAIMGAAAMLTKWHRSDCRYDIHWGTMTFKMTFLWTTFAVLKYFMGVLTRQLTNPKKPDTLVETMQNGGTTMSINVVPAGKDKFKVLVDYVQRGIAYSSRDLANQEAKKLHDKELPHAELHLAIA